MDNKALYNAEREKRWTMAKEKEPEAIAAICHILEQASGHRVEYARYDERWFDKFAPDLPENRWVRGASDYVIRLDGKKYVYAEIKLKSLKFRKTKYGGTTQKGSVIADYGCESFYLDIDPVYHNMCAFVEKTKIESRNFIIFFVNEALSEIYAISLEKIQNMVKNGYNGQKLCEFTEGYGTDTASGPARNYLIPEQAAELLNYAHIERHSTPDIVTSLPAAPEYYYAGTMFYHRSRDCRYIVHKSGEKIRKISRREAEDKRLMPCRECCSAGG